MPHELLEREDIVKKVIYNPRDPIATVFSAVKELLEFANITGSSYTKFRAINIGYVILRRTGKFRLEICEWNRMPEVQKTWVFLTVFPDVSQQSFRTSHTELRETSDLTFEGAGMYHANMVLDVVAGVQEAL